MSRLGSLLLRAEKRRLSARRRPASSKVSSLMMAGTAMVIHSSCGRSYLAWWRDTARPCRRALRLMAGRRLARAGL